MLNPWLTKTNVAAKIVWQLKSIARLAGLGTLTVTAITLAGCTSGTATRTSAAVYQPTDSSRVEILFEKPSRPYKVVGTVRAYGDPFSSDDSIFRAAQKEAAELGAHAIIVPGYSVDANKVVRAMAIRFTDGSDSGGAYSVTPTKSKSTTQKAEQIVK